jgi:hypothetical protein
MDERVLPSFAYDENWVNPELGERQRLDVDRFKPVMDDYYRLRGWEVDTGWPTCDRLARLDLEGVYDDMVAGAQNAQERLPELPPEGPGVDHLKKTE